MKKILMFLFLLFFPTLVFASNVDYKVTDILVDATVEENGDMKVKELIVLDGTFNGYIRDIRFTNVKLKYNNPVNFESDAIYNASGIYDTKIKAKKITGKATFETMNESFDTLTNSSAAIAKNKNYVMTSGSGMNSYKMYYESDDEKVAFLLEYALKDVVVLHDDIAELYWTFIGEGFDDKIGNVEVRVALPEKDEGMRFWAHGDLTGDIWKNSENEVIANIQKLPANSPLDIRMTFYKNLVNESVTKKSYTEALPSILNVETKRAEEANEKREKAKKVVLILTISSIAYIIILIIYWIYVYLKYDKEYKPEFNLEYNREFIDDYNVEVVQYLMKNTIAQDAFSASILNLVYKKNLKLEEIPGTTKKKNYEFTLLTRENLNDTENYLVDFLFDKVGKDGKFTTKDLESYASSTKTYTSFESSYQKWVSSATKDAKNENFYEKTSSAISFSFLFLFIGLVILYFSFQLQTGLILPWICGILAVIFLFYCAFLKKKTKRGIEHYTRWKAFKKFLEDFGTFDTKELPEIALWERYLVYATVFGIADKVQKSMNVKIKELNLNDASSYSYYPSWVDYNIASSINHSIHDSFKANQQTYSRETASSSSSSGFGSGGGFSSGGGFGGGGGGGRGF